MIKLPQTVFGTLFGPFCGRCDRFGGFNRVVGSLSDVGSFVKGSDVVHSVGQRRNGVGGWGGGGGGGLGRGEGREKCGTLSVTEGEGVGGRERRRAVTSA